MFGWEFPPFNSGGLGTACYGLTKALSHKGVEIDFVLPKSLGVNEDFMNIISANLPKTNFTLVDSLLTSYMTEETYQEALKRERPGCEYRGDLIDEVMRYASLAGEIAAESDCDMVHCHDWMTLPAGIQAKAAVNKPLITHIHSTEADRSGGNYKNPRIARIEEEGIREADRVIAVSGFTKRKIAENYDIDASKIDVVHNGVEHQEFESFPEQENPFNRKIVLFLGRLTLQKGPDYFLRAAKKVLEKRKDVIFVVSGSGDMERKVIREACQLGIADKVLFTGFLKDDMLKKVYKLANLYVMPSVSEPFGITTLEAVSSGTPVLISKQSGVSEVLNHCLKVDFWDTDAMAAKIISVLDNPTLEAHLARNGKREVAKLNWAAAADRVISVYEKMMPLRYSYK